MATEVEAMVVVATAEVATVEAEMEVEATVAATAVEKAAVAKGVEWEAAVMVEVVMVVG